MARSIAEAISYEASKKFWSFKVDDTPSDAPESIGMNSDEWLSLSPGYRREIMRQFAPEPQAKPPIDPVQSAKDRKAAVEYAARKRL